MKKIIIDTNVLLSFITDRNLSQQQKASVIFNEAAALKKEIIYHQEVLSEFVYVMQSVYSVSRRDIRDILKELAAMPGVTITSNMDFDLVVKFWPEHISDYGDAVIASLCKKTNNSTIATFDRQFIKELAGLGISGAIQ